MANLFLQNKCVGDVLEGKNTEKLLVLGADTTVAAALETFKENGIVAAPVRDRESGDIVAIIGVEDILLYVAFASNLKAGELPSASQLAESTSFDVAVQALVGATAESTRVWSVAREDNLRGLLEMFSKGVHRVLVGENILAQVDVGRFILKGRENIGDPILGASLANNGLANPAHTMDSLVRVSPATTALEAFRIMGQKGLNALPVCEENGSLVTQLSASDLRGLDRASVAQLLEPVGKFLEGRYGAVVKPITVFPHDPTEKALTAMVGASVHRVWVIDAQNRATGVVSLTDVLCKFSPFDFQEQA
eukprot:CAMPEP_0119122392 /NCGR_PEP_ID=MMETSP1310-20130426/2661_1 /TAXON_ID=464262 /ORGANISM="Genus nov. species nov., Strain RCC2339" /LENGTH=306 /DNA_ID=CAMNT_0007112041 /DNA_START=52 /DNA_END=968 /DNA_ORIENTATION=-